MIPPAQLFDGLLPWQHGSAVQYWSAFERYGVAVNASEMGLGKTYVTASLLRLQPEIPTLVVCPLAVVPTWERVLDQFGFAADVTNYEQAKIERRGFGHWETFQRGSKTYKRWQWADGLEQVVFDEVHRCGGLATENSLLLRAAKRQQRKLLMLSGTLAESPLQMKALGYALDLYGKPDQPPKDFLSFLYRNGVVPTKWGLKFTGRGGHGNSPGERQEWFMSQLNRQIFPDRGTRLTIAEVGDDFPETAIRSELYQTADDGREIQRLYRELAAEVDAWKNRAAGDRNPEHPLTKRLRERELIELLKVGIFADVAEDALASKHSVVIFVSFIATLRALAEKFPDFEIFYGGCSDSERRGALDRFQSNASPGIILQIDSGGTGVDLHDLQGGHTREVLLSPGYSIKNLRQALKRTHRAGAKTVSIQHLFFVKGTIEEEIYRALQRKGNNLDALHDADLTPSDLRLDIPVESSYPPRAT